MPLHPLTFTTSPSRWQALTTRSPNFHSAFVYCILTTRIYCRPTCPSRLARRANIIFHDTAGQAETAGFRPCKRCKPEVDGWQAGGEVSEKVQRVKGMIRDGAERGRVPGLGELAGEVGLSRSHLLRVFRRVVGCTPKEWGDRVEGGKGIDASLFEVRDGGEVEGWLDGSGYDGFDMRTDALGLTNSGGRPWSSDGGLGEYLDGGCGIANAESTDELWDLYFNDLGLPLETSLPPEPELDLQLTSQVGNTSLVERD